jgi:FMN phosphatase YigB (HAD superfamily)
MNCLVLDAMGVIFEAADDVSELLIPFIAAEVGDFDEQIIQSTYLRASLGQISADNFWAQVNLSAALEDDFLSRHILSPGVNELLHYAWQKEVPVWCLSNDVGRWSEKLRNNFEIEKLLTGSVISGDVGVRKPDRKIYEVLIEHCGHKIEDLLFVDDREKNIEAARSLGIDSILFQAETGFGEVRSRVSQREL